MLCEEGGGGEENPLNYYFCVLLLFSRFKCSYRCRFVPYTDLVSIMRGQSVPTDSFLQLHLVSIERSLHSMDCPPSL